MKTAMLLVCFGPPLVHACWLSLRWFFSSLDAAEALYVWTEFSDPDESWRAKR